MSSNGTAIPAGASAAVLKPSEPVPDVAVSVEGPNFDQDVSLSQLLNSYKRIGFQASSLAKAIEIVNKMVSLRPTSTQSMQQRMTIAELEALGRTPHGGRVGRTPFSGSEGAN